MLNFDSIKAKLSGSISKFSGQKDYLEAVCAASALVAAADGEIADNELKTISESLANHPTLSKSFKSSQISQCADTMLKRAQGGRMSRNELYKELDQIRTSVDKSEAVYLCALDIAHADGKVQPEETKVLREVAKRLGVNPDAYDSI